MIYPDLYPPPCLLNDNMEENDSATMLTAKRSAGVKAEMNLNECVTCTPPPSANKTGHSGF